jgi:hypothetical protein
MSDLEVPTAPPSPVLEKATLHRPIPQHATKLSPPSLSPPQVASSPSRSRKERITSKTEIKADDPLCAICHKKLSYHTDKAAAEEHANDCWDMLREKFRDATEQDTWSRNYLWMSDRQIELLKAKRLEREKIASNSSHVLEIGANVPPKDLPPTSSLLCAKDVSSMQELEVFEHRVFCLTAHNPSSCPVCQASFSDFCKNDVVFHLYSCQHGGTLSPFQIEDFNALVAAFSGRLTGASTLVQRTFGPKKNWTTRQHRQCVQTKRDSGIRDEGGLYVAEASPLRTAQMVLPSKPFNTDTQFEITTYQRAKVLEYVSIDKFRRRAFPAMVLPEGKTPHGDFKVETVVRETITVIKPEDFWAKLRFPPPLPARPSPAVPSIFPKKKLPPPLLTRPSPIVPDQSLKKLPVDGAVAENFPVTDNKAAGKLSVYREMSVRPKLLRHPPSIAEPNASIPQLRTLLEAPTRPASPKNRMELNENQTKSLGLFRPQTSVAKANEAVNRPSAILLRPVRRFLNIVFTCLPEDDEPFAPAQQTRTSSMNYPPVRLHDDSSSANESPLQMPPFPFKTRNCS